MNTKPKSRNNPAALLLLILVPVLAIIVYTKFLRGDSGLAEEKAAAQALKERKIDGRAAYLVITEPPDGKVTSVNFLGHPVDDETMKLVGKLFRISALNADKCKITDDQLKHLAGLVGMSSLVLSDTPITNKGLEHLKPLVGIEALHLSGTKISDAGLDHLAAMPNLKILNISSLPHKTVGIGSFVLRQSLPAGYLSFYPLFKVFYIILLFGLTLRQLESNGLFFCGRFPFFLLRFANIQLRNSP